MTARIQVRRDSSSNWTTVNPTLTAGEFGFETDTGAVKIGDGSTPWTSLSYTSYPTWTTYTITLAQGTATDIAKTATYVKYLRTGKTVTVQAQVSATDAGDDTNAITLGLPFTAATSGIVVGSGYYNDGGTQYQAIAYLYSTTKVALLSTHGTASTNTDDPIGVNPNIAVASGDIISVQFTYEAA